MRNPLQILTILAVLAAMSAPAIAGPLSTYSPMLVARGNGIVMMSGSGQAEITWTGFLIAGADTVLVLPAGTDEPLEMSDGRLLYAHIDGTVRLSGALDIVCGGAAIMMFARCDGTVELFGYGYYIKGFRAGVWDADGVTVSSRR